MTKCYVPYIPISDLISIIYFSKATPATSQFLKQTRHSPTSLFPYALPAVSEMLFFPQLSMGFHGGSDRKSVCLQCWRPGFNPWVRKIPWRRKWQPTPVLLPGKPHGQRSLVGYRPWGHSRT